LIIPLGDQGAISVKLYSLKAGLRCLRTVRQDDGGICSDVYLQTSSYLHFLLVNYQGNGHLFGYML